MTIEQNDNRVQIKSLRLGDVFVGKKGSVLMKIESFCPEGGEEEYNVVNLKNGLLYHYDATEYVDKKTNAILKI